MDRPAPAADGNTHHHTNGNLDTSRHAYLHADGYTINLGNADRYRYADDYFYANYDYAANGEPGQAAIGGDVALRAIVAGDALRPPAEVDQAGSGQLEAVEEPADVLSIARVELG